MPMLHTQLLLLSAFALRAIVHVGPHKVGSTSLQEALVKGRETLASENFALCPPNFAGGTFRGAKSCANVANCLSGSSGRSYQLHSSNERHRRGLINCTLVMRDFGNFLDEARRAGRSIVLSAENFDNPSMDIPSLASYLHGFETEVVVLHRPFFDWLRSFYSELHPPISLEEFAIDRILDGGGRDQSSVAVYTRYSQRFRNVTMRGLAAGYITRFVCIDVGAKAFCRHLQTTPEIQSNANKSVAHSHGGCMAADQKEHLWAVSAVMEAQAQALMATGETAMNLTELRDRFAQAPYRVC